MPMFIPEITTRVIVEVDTTELDEALSLANSESYLGDYVDVLEEKRTRLNSFQEPVAEAVALDLKDNQENIISSKHFITGAMSESVDISPDGKDRLVGNTACSVDGFPYPLAIEKGTVSHWIEPITYDALHWVEGGTDYFSKGHMVSGINADPFVQASIDDTIYDIEQIVKDALGDL